MQLQVCCNRASCLFHITMLLGRGKLIHSLEENKPCHYSREYAPTCHLILRKKNPGKQNITINDPIYLPEYLSKHQQNFIRNHHQHFGHWVNQFKEISIPSLSLLSSPEGHFGKGRDCAWSNWFLGHTVSTHNVSAYLKMHMLVTIYSQRTTLSWKSQYSFQSTNIFLPFSKKMNLLLWFYLLNIKQKRSKSIYIIFVVHCNFCIIFHRLLHSAMSHFHCLWKFPYLFSLIQKVLTKRTGRLTKGDNWMQKISSPFHDLM